LLVLERNHQPRVVDSVLKSAHGLLEPGDALAHLSQYFRAAAASSMAWVAIGMTPSIGRKPWTMPSYRLARASTPPCCKASAYASPSSRSGSYSAVITSAGGRLVRSGAY